MMMRRGVIRAVSNRQLYLRRHAFFQPATPPKRRFCRHRHRSMTACYSCSIPAFSTICSEQTVSCGENPVRRLESMEKIL